jgi:DNA-directed RNA polymerase II subunit RPB1
MKKGEFDDVFNYKLDDENWRPTYILPKHVDDFKTKCEFINVFEAKVQKLEANQFQLGTCTYCY